MFLYSVSFCDDLSLRGICPVHVLEFPTICQFHFCNSLYKTIIITGIPENAGKFTWIFTSILSSEMLLRIEQLLARTKVVSIFATADKRLLHNAVRVKDNAVEITAMETALPYLYMLRQLRTAYLEAWQDLCGGRRGRCRALQRLKPRQFIQTFFNPSISARRKTPISFMLIVYRSSAADDYLDVEIPGGDTGPGDTSTVSAVMATVEDNGSTMVPSVVITQTVATLNFTQERTESQTLPGMSGNVEGLGKLFVYL